MKSKVTLKELVGTKIVYSMIVVFYYWMWARRDWQDYYQTIQFMVSIFTVVFFCLQASRIRKYHKEEKDELAICNLRRADSLCLKILVAITVLSAFASVFITASNLPASILGYILVLSLLVVTVIRFISFCIMDSKGI